MRGLIIDKASRLYHLVDADDEGKQEQHAKDHGECKHEGSNKADYSGAFHGGQIYGNVRDVITKYYASESAYACLRAWPSSSFI
jgi:hypothetical protein